MKSSAATRIDTKFLDSREIRLVQSLETALGADILRLKRDPEIVEIYTNADGSLWYERLGSGCQDTGLVLSPADRRRVHRPGARVHPPGGRGRHRDPGAGRPAA